MASAEDKNKTLDSAIYQIQKQFGKGSIMRLGSAEAEAVSSISTGTLSLDIATGMTLPLALLAIGGGFSLKKLHGDLFQAAAAAFCGGFRHEH